MKYTTVEEFLKNNPDFNIYNSNPITKKFEKAITRAENSITIYSGDFKI